MRGPFDGLKLIGWVLLLPLRRGLGNQLGTILRNLKKLIGGLCGAGWKRSAQLLRQLLLFLTPQLVQPLERGGFGGSGASLGRGADRAKDALRCFRAQGSQRQRVLVAWGAYGRVMQDPHQLVASTIGLVSVPRVAAHRSALAEGGAEGLWTALHWGRGWGRVQEPCS